MSKSNIRFYSVREAPFTIDGLWNPSEPGFFRRMPAEIAEQVSPGVASNAIHTTGGRVRFCTNATSMTIRSDVERKHMQNMVSVGSSGFDLYQILDDGNQKLLVTYTHHANDCDYAGNGVSRSLPGGKMCEYVLYLPLYSHMTELSLGFPEEATVTAPITDYRIAKPIVYYGSSITQGASASRPGLSYEAIISRRLQAQFWNLGFAGAAKGEDAMIDYLAGIPEMSAFVCDYDYNAQNAEHLRSTHEKLYRAVREKHPTLPIVLVSAPVYNIASEGWIARRGVIMETYLNGLKAGDRNLHFVDGFTMMLDDSAGEGLIDGCHPNDLGMHRMAYAIGETLRAILYK